MMTARLRIWLEIFFVSLRLGLTSFGGPVAHLGYFRNEYVKRRKWLDEHSYADIVALCQFLPGPASSQVGISIGMIRGGIVGGIISWIGFTLPSVVMLILFAYLFISGDFINEGLLHGLKIVAVAVVAQAVIEMGRKLTPDRTRITIAIVAASITLLYPTALGQILLIIAAGFLGYRLFLNGEKPKLNEMELTLNKKTGIIAILLFFALLIGLPVLRSAYPSMGISMFDTFYRVGSIVFGGGHVVLPLLEREVVPTGWLSDEAFLTGYGAAQAVPGPLFTFASYLGTMILGWKGAIIATVAIFLPSFLLVMGVLPFWNSIRKYTAIQAALMGVNAAVVGILLAALYHPIWTSSIKTTTDFILGLVAFTLLVFWKLPPWIVVLFAGASGYVISII